MEYQAPKNTSTQDIKPADTSAPKTDTKPTTTKPESTDIETVRLRESNKHLRTWLTVMICLVVAGTVGTLVFYQQKQSNAKQVASQQQEISSLQKDQLVAKQAEYEQTIKTQTDTIAQQQAQIDTLTKQVADLQKQLDEAKKAATTTTPPTQ